jgi:ribosomal protein L32
MRKQKCPNCGEWNSDEKACTKCEYTLDFKERRVEEEEKKAQNYLTREKDKLEQFLHDFKTSKYVIVRMIYYVLYSIWMVYFAIISFFAALIAWSPG